MNNKFGKDTWKTFHVIKVKLLTKNRNKSAILNFFSAITVVIRYNTIGGVHKYESCYKPIVLYEMARFYLVLLDTTWLDIHGMR